MTDIPKTYDPTKVEGKWYQYWTDHNLFAVDPKSPKPPFCILMPPPNITGQLHMGHALQDAIQDYLIRMKRMQGYESHWQPGKDHAGIATQNVVEQSLVTEGLTRHQLGREKFIQRAWEWKERYGNRIFEQKRLLGDSADWSRERFTLDDGLSKAVTQTFVSLYRKGLVYRGNYIVNWCPRCHTAISDDEVEHEDHQGHLWYFRYPLSDGTGYVTVATTRPETMLGDTAVAVNPDDDRMRPLWDKTVMLPLAEREIPIIRDDFVNPEFGTGQVKVTPAHDPNDFDMGQRHNLASITVIDEDGKMNENVPDRFRGLDRFQARKAVVKAMDELGLLEKIENYTNSVGHCYRCHTVIEPYLSLQWFVKMKPLAGPAIEAVRDGRIKFHPQRWAKVYYAWMENIRDWCISRQLWWGHRIPVWYCNSCDEVIVAEHTPDHCTKCNSTDLRQDEDVLDTWFSSWLWPFSALGWPQEIDGMKKWYPTDVMVTGYDIIYFWVARMVMAGMEFIGEIPFHDVYITGMIKDELGRWMSKSLGNGIDPADMIEQYGSDAVRFTLVTLATEGQDIKLSPSRFEGGRNFANKLWNTYRFLMSNVDRLDGQLTVESSFDLPDDAPLEDRWIISRFHSNVEKVLNNAEKYRLSDCLTAIYDFIWKDYCDWYLEMIKVRLTQDTPDNVKRETLSRAVALFEASLRLLHPGMPFITEELWQGLKPFLDGNDDNSIMVADYPHPEEFPQDKDAERDMDFLQRLIGAVRNIRSEMCVPPDRKGQLIVSGCDENRQQLIATNLVNIKRLAGLSDIVFDANRPDQSATAVIGDVELFMPLAGLIDVDVERKRLDKEIARLQKVVKGAEAKLSNPKFLEKAPEQIQHHERQKL
ncbi:MAG: valine--tRNA ligase, partial [Candidatus Electryoneaceae bacterium]|nr:valine--tRNA ligase [Candidatus Electryoneaceae bacterium]